MTIYRLSETHYAVETDTVLSDGTLRADSCMALRGAELRSVEHSGDLRIGGLMTVKLGPKSLPIVKALSVGGSYTVTR